MASWHIILRNRVQSKRKKKWWAIGGFPELIGEMCIGLQRSVYNVKSLTNAGVRIQCDQSYFKFCRFWGKEWLLYIFSVQSVQLLSCVRLFVTPWTTAHQASLSITNSWSLCPSSRWYHPTISSSVIPFYSCSQSVPASGSFQMSQLFALGDQVLEFQL